ncbi:hypothetical protein Enr13x_03040 [Stieleria neptunia]|uniref:Glucosylceramidase n=1 Tax=Stieleria neptunia TaxID=2527979 RepID=A0A518HI24_9BACT|nr:GH116 family glycosyl-hydrolase [Stieleria neptunia]QDV40498.1 hypothetical protein Enr13x_03040 [Stieleria neptunia]
MDLTKPEIPTPSSCSSSCGCEPNVNRRNALKVLGAGATASTLPIGAPVMAGPFAAEDVAGHLIPADKKLASEWIASLTQRGRPEVFSGDQLKYIGMPVGGIGCGQLYLAGDGRLWLWDIFKCNYTRETGHGQRIAAFTLGGHYAHPVAAGEEYTKRNGADVAQGFLIRVTTSAKATTRTLDRQGFPGVTFRGEYPIGKVTYAEQGFPVATKLEAFTPFIPLRTKDSALPATVMAYTVTNTSESSVQVDLGSWMQNATCPYTTDVASGQRRNQVVQADGKVGVLSTVEPTSVSDGTRAGVGIQNKHGYGSTTLTLLHDANEAGLTVSAAASLTDPDSPAGLFEQARDLSQQEEAVRPLGELLVGGLFAGFRLAPGESRTVEFVVTWYFPDYNEKGARRRQMLGIKDFAKLRRHYAPWFDSADGVADYLCKNKQRLLDGTRRWNKTWYDSTLPYWLLDRSFIPLDCVASQAFHWFDSGRPYAWEGVDCCPGTCTHVWHYAQALGRVFPELERAFREKVDFQAGVGFHPQSGIIGHRGEIHASPATDGQAGSILRAYREHQMSADSAFLKRIWPNVKKAVEYLIGEDGDGNGLLEGKQPHTLDASWFGPMGWLSGMYLAALAAGEAMAIEMADTEFAMRCRTMIDRGSERIVTELFDGEYFIHKPDPTVRALNSNKGCHIDQVLGQAWMKQVGLGRVIPKRETVSALHSLWKYNFAPDAGQYALDHIQIEQAFRWYAMPGEAGLVMCTWPKGGATDAIPGDRLRTEENPAVYTGPGGYFNECMNGFEYQVAAHMVYEGNAEDSLVEKGLAIAKAVHERYGANKRNPYNEIECSDHYARSMASYGVFLAVCGFEYHGPQGRIGFAPRVSPSNFKAPFTAAEGWGSFTQKVTDDQQSASIEMYDGKLALKEFALDQVQGTAASRAVIVLDGDEIPAEFRTQQGRYVVRFPQGLDLKAGQTLQVRCVS